MLALGKVKPGSTIYVPFESFASSSGAPITISGLATSDIKIYKNGGTTERASASGFTLLDSDGIDFDSITGIHGFSVDLADNTTSGFYVAGASYFIVISTITVDSQTMSFIAATFEIGYSAAMLDTTIATLSSQTSFTLTAGPAEDDALNGRAVIIHDIASAVQCGQAVILDYTGSTKTVTLAAGTTFTAAAGDNISIMGPAPLQPSVTGRQLVLNSSGEAEATDGGGNALATAASVALIPQRAEIAAITRGCQRLLYVAKTGDDTDGSTPAKAYTTVSAAVAAASSSIKTLIVIYNGTYAEQVTIDKPVYLLGMDPNYTKIVFGDTPAVGFLDGCDGAGIENLWIETTESSGGIGLVNASSGRIRDIILKNLHVVGYYDGAQLSQIDNLQIIGGYFLGHWDGANVTLSNGRIDGAVFESDATFSSGNQACSGLYADENETYFTVTGAQFRVSRTNNPATPSADTPAVRLAGKWTFVNSIFKASSTHASNAKAVQGIRREPSAGASLEISLIGGTIFTSNVGGSAYDIQTDHTDDTHMNVQVSGTRYGRTKVSGTKVFEPLHPVVNQRAFSVNSSGVGLADNRDGNKNAQEDTLGAVVAKTNQLTFTDPGKVDATAELTGGGDASAANQQKILDILQTQDDDD